MDLKQLQALGGFVSTELVPKTIQFTRPRLPEEGEGDPISDSAEIHVRKRTSRDFLEITRAPEAERAFIALQRCVCTPDGAPLFPDVEQASQLAEWLFAPMMFAVNEVNTFVPKAWAARMSSGSTSPRSTGAASRKRSSQSRKKSGPTG